MKALLLVILTTALFNTQANEAYIPKVLKPWKEWVLKDSKDKLCPYGESKDSGNNICVWPSDLSLKLNDRGGSFKGKWQVFNVGEVLLPGGKANWPLAIKVNGKASPVSSKGSIPTLRLNSGKYEISGKFKWNKLPRRLALPRGIGTVALSINGKRVAIPKVISDVLWINTKQEVVKNTKEEFLSIKVFRELDDSIPMIDQTIIKIKFAGKERELSLDNIFLEGFEPYNFNSSLPLQLNKNGQLKLQLRPGEWYLTFWSRSLKSKSELSLNKSRMSLPQQEIWIFKENHKNRYVKVSGVKQVDSSLIDIPRQLKKGSTYILKNNDIMKFSVTKRGLSHLDSNKLSLTRTMWLDFKGDAYTIKDQINGSMNKEWRLEMKRPYALGSAKVNGKNQLITNNKNSEFSGVEIREGKLALTSEARFANDELSFKNIGWNVDFNKASGKMHLPPGWESIALIGPDKTTGTWMSKWSLFKLFFVLIVAIGIGKIKNFKWGTIVFIGLSLLIHERGAPYTVWLHLLIAWAIALALKDKSKIVKFVNMYRVAALVALVSISFPFIVGQIQETIYPTLEKQSNRSFYSKIGSGYASKSVKDHSEETIEVKSVPMLNKSAGFRPKKSKMKRVARKNRKAIQQYDSDSIIQTGPGLPSWSWGTISFRWEGPVSRSQGLKLIALSPIVNKIVTIIRIIFLLLLIFCFLDIGKKDILKPRNWKMFKNFFVMCIVAVSLNSQKVSAQEIPNKEVLKELKNRLLEKPKCLPHCLSISTMNIDYSRSQLSLRLKVHSQAKLYVNLPGDRSHWYPSLILVNGKKSSTASNFSNSLKVLVNKGISNIVLTGPLPEVESVTLSLPTVPKYVSTKGTGWSIEGLKNSGKVDKSIRLYRQLKSTKKKNTYKDSKLTEFFKVERKIKLGINWEIETVVNRLTPAKSSTILKVPMLAGESLTNAGVRSENGVAFVQFNKAQRYVSWSSTLNHTNQLKLKSLRSEKYFETWNVEPGHIWNIKFSGIPMTENKNYKSNYSPRWMPWPEEEVVVDISRPKAVQGSALTLRNASYTAKPGKRLTAHELVLDFQTSLGKVHKIKLDKESLLDEVTINKKSQSLSLDNGILTIPLGVGKQVVKLKWKTNKGMSFSYKTPKIDVGVQGVNLKTKIEMSDSRWVFAVGGPVLGPAILFWGKLIGLIIISFFLSKISWIPMSFTQWGILSLGMTQGFSAGILIVFGFLLFTAYRNSSEIKLSNGWYNVSQLITIFWTIMSISTFLFIIQSGLLGGPDMGIEGNLSSSYTLNWFSDRFTNTLPQSYVISLPKLAYQISMLLWSIWAAFSIASWSKWIWSGIYVDGFWKKLERKPKKDNEIEIEIE